MVDGQLEVCIDSYQIDVVTINVNYFKHQYLQFLIFLAIFLARLIFVDFNYNEA